MTIPIKDLPKDAIVTKVAALKATKTSESFAPTSLQSSNDDTVTYTTTFSIISPQKMPPQISLVRPKKDCAVQSIQKKPQVRFDAATQTMGRGMKVFKKLPLFLVHRIFLELASIGRKESVLSSLVTRELAFKIQQSHYEGRDVHWTHMEDYGKSLQKIQSRSYAPSKSTDLTLKGFTLDLRSELKTHQSGIQGGNFVKTKSHSCDRIEMLRTVLHFSVANFTVFGFYRRLMQKESELPKVFLKSVEHMTCTEDGNCELQTWSNDIAFHKSNTFYNVQSLWISGLDKVPLEKLSHTMFTFPSVKCVYLIYHLDSETKPKMETFVESFKNFARLNYLSNQARIAIILRHDETVSKETAKMLEKRVNSQLESYIIDDRFSFYLRRTAVAAMRSKSCQSLSTKEGRKRIHEIMDPLWKSEEQLRQTCHKRMLF